MNEQEILDDPAITYWLKEQIQSSRSRDCLDALNDAELLLEILQQRYKNLK